MRNSAVASIRQGIARNRGHGLPHHHVQAGLRARRFGRKQRPRHGGLIIGPLIARHEARAGVSSRSRNLQRHSRAMARFEDLAQIVGGLAGNFACSRATPRRAIRRSASPCSFRRDPASSRPCIPKVSNRPILNEALFEKRFGRRSPGNSPASGEAMVSVVFETRLLISRDADTRAIRSAAKSPVRNRRRAAPWHWPSLRLTPGSTASEARSRCRSALAIGCRSSPVRALRCRTSR